MELSQFLNSLKEKEKEKIIHPELPIEFERKTGKTTRLVNLAIETLFTTGYYQAIDHYLDGKHKASNKSLFLKVAKRLQSEHIADYSYHIHIDNIHLTFNYIKPL